MISMIGSLAGRGRGRGTPSSTLLLVVSSLMLCAHVPGIFSSNVVTLQSIVIYTTHEWLPLKPTIYFRCLGDGENVTILPDVKETNYMYTFKGEESWQPLTELPDKKCKRCGLYQRDTIKSDDVFDEWELCLDDFINGTSVHFKRNEFNATFRCPVNETSKKDSSPISNPEDEEKEKGNSSGKHVSVTLVVVISAVVSVVVIIGLVAGFKYWQKWKRQQDQARFLKIFEEGDDIEDELELSTVL